MPGGRDILREKIESGEADMAALSRAAGRNHAYVQQFLKRGVPRELPEDVRDGLASVLGVHPDMLREGPKAAPPPPTFHPKSDVQPVAKVNPGEPRRLPLTAQVPVMGTVACGEDGQFAVNLTDGPIEYVDLPAKLVGVPGVIALFVAGDSMAGIWAPGDIVYVAKKRPVTPGAYAVVLVEDGPGHPPAAYLKEYVRGSNDTVVLRQYNPNMEMEIERQRVRDMWRALHWREWAS
jgi:phage repressor protein C with HTH and peptisase S24 domain